MMVPGTEGEAARPRHPVFIDNCAWDVFFEAGLALNKELPSEDFVLCITREAEFELVSLAKKRPDLRAYIDRTVSDCDVRVHSYFGFFQEDHAADEQRIGGFDQGCWISQPEMDFIVSQRSKFGTTKKPSTRLFKNEADIALVAVSLHSIVLTLDQKKGPLRDALNQGGRVVLLNDLPMSGMSLRTYIEARI